MVAQESKVVCDIAEANQDGYPSGVEVGCMYVKVPSVHCVSNAAIHFEPKFESKSPQNLVGKPRDRWSQSLTRMHWQGKSSGVSREGWKAAGRVT